MSDLPALYTHYHHLLFSIDRVPLAMASILAVSLFGVATGPVMGNANSFICIMADKLLGGLGGRLDRMQRNSGDLIMRGFFLTMIGLAVFFMAGRFAQHVSMALPLKGLTDIALLTLAMTAGSVWFALLRLYYTLKTRKVTPKTYYTIAKSIRTDLSGNDNYTVTRMGMGFAARAFDKGVVAPVFWYLIGGLPLVYIYAGLYGLAWRFGRDGHTHGFGRVALELERLMGFIPGLLAGFLMALAGLLTPTGGMTRAFVGLMRKKGRAPYFEGGLPLTAMAYSLNVALGGPTVDLDGRNNPRAWVGPEKSTAMLDSGHLRRALYISIMAHLLFLAVLGGSLFAGSGQLARFFG